MSNTIFSPSGKLVIRPRLELSKTTLDYLFLEATKQGCRLGFVISKLLEEYHEKAQPAQKSLF